MSTFASAVPLMLSMRDVRIATGRALAAVPSLACACAPMFGALVRHVAVRRGTATTINATLEHLYNATMQPVAVNVTAEYDVRQTRQDFLFPQAPAQAANRSWLRRVAVHYVNDRCEPKRVVLDAERAHCMQSCEELFAGRSIYAE